jgi:hypothetical protein
MVIVFSFEVNLTPYTNHLTRSVGRRNKAAFSRAHCEGALIYVIRTATGNPVTVVDPVTAPKSIGWKKAELEELVDRLASKGVNREALLAAVVAIAAV